MRAQAGCGGGVVPHVCFPGLVKNADVSTARRGE